MRKTIEVSESEYTSIMMMRSILKGIEGVDKATEDGDKSAICVFGSQKKELLQSIDDLKKRKEELHHFLQFVDNHDNHELYMHSYTKESNSRDGKGVEFKGSFTSHGIKEIVEYLLKTIDDDIETANEMLKPMLRIEKTLKL